LEKLEAFRQKKAKEKLERMERIQKRLEQIRGQHAAAAGRGSVQMTDDRPPPDSLLRDTTNCVASSKRQLPARAKIISQKLKQSNDADVKSGRRLTITLSSASDTNETESEQKKNNVINNGQEITSGEDVPQVDEKMCTIGLGKRYYLHNCSFCSMLCCVRVVCFIRLVYFNTYVAVLFCVKYYVAGCLISAPTMSLQKRLNSCPSTNQARNLRGQDSKLLAECCSCIAEFCYSHNMLSVCHLYIVSILRVYCEKTTGATITQFSL